MALESDYTFRGVNVSSAYLRVPRVSFSGQREKLRDASGNITGRGGYHARGIVNVYANASETQSVDSFVHDFVYNISSQKNVFKQCYESLRAARPGSRNV